MDHKRTATQLAYPMKPETKRQIWSQIWLPFIIGILIVSGIVTGLMFARVGTASAWADTAFVFLFLPLLLVGIIVIATVGALIYFVGRAMRRLPGPLRMVDARVKQAEGMARRVSGQLVKPFIVLPAGWASIQAVIDKILSIFRAE
jgi:membrane protein implicated in regulation of membrane protease activity